MSVNQLKGELHTTIKEYSIETVYTCVYNFQVQLTA